MVHPALGNAVAVYIRAPTITYGIYGEGKHGYIEFEGYGSL